MRFNDIIGDYITQQRSLGKRYSGEANTLKAFARSIGNVLVRDINPEMISCFLDRGATSYETRRKKYRALAGLFFFAVSRRLLKTSPMPRWRKRPDHAQVARADQPHGLGVHRLGLGPCRARSTGSGLHQIG